MNAFIIHSGSDAEEVEELVRKIHQAEFSFNSLQLTNGGKLWKLSAKEKIKKSQMVIFFVGKNSHKSENIEWEIKTAKKYNKEIVCVLLGKNYTIHKAAIVEDSFSGEKKPIGAVYKAYNDDNDNSDNQYNPKEYEDLILKIKNFESKEYNILNENGDKLDTDLLIEQYKLFLQTSETLVQRRQSVNNFYISVNSAIVALFSATVAINVSYMLKLVIGAVFLILGIILCQSWIRILNSYGNLNSSKMTIISNIEKNLPASLYDAEWAALSDKLNKKKYVSFTNSEKTIPILFTVLYSILFAVVVVSIFFI